MKNTHTHLVAEGLERLERAEAVLERLGGDAEHADHGEAAVLEVGGLELEDGGVVGGGREAEWVEVAAGVAALVGHINKVLFTPQLLLMYGLEPQW